MFKNIIISGLTAAGKTTHSKILSAEFGLTYVGASQLLLQACGVDPLTANRNFWLSEKGIEISRRMTEVNVEDLLIEKFKNTNYSVFDCLSLPYMINSSESLTIWLESNVESRVMKAAISHESNNVTEELANEVTVKDQNSLCALRHSLNNISVGSDLSCFDIIIDISSFIEEVNISSSWKSINKAQRILHSSIGYFLTEDKYFFDNIIHEIQKSDKFIKKLTIKSSDILELF